MIKGLSERRRLPRLGKIKLGVIVQEPGKKPYPRATDYFVVPPVVAKVHGERPRVLPIMFPVDEAGKLLPQLYKMYRHSGLFCAGDGEMARRWTERGELKEIACPCPFLESGECGPVATLNCLLPDVPGIGVWQITFGNQRSIVSLNTSLEQFSRTFGGLSGIPFNLLLEPEQIQRFDEKSGKMVKQTLHVLRLDTTHTLREIVEWRSKSGKPVEALMPAPEPEGEEQETRAAEETEAPPQDDLGIWDVTRCFEAAKRLGVEAADYAAYLLGVYGKDVDNIPSEALREQRDLLSKALAEEQQGRLLAQAMRQVSAKIRKRNGRQDQLI